MGGAVSYGANNSEMVNNLVKARYIKSPAVENVFRAVDRGNFYLPDHRKSAYRDMAWKHVTYHLSTPCIYAEVLEALEMKEGCSFLNMGCGIGYLSTMAGLIIGSKGINHGIEYYSENIRYAQQKINEFILTDPNFDKFDFCIPKMVVGNCLFIERYDFSDDDSDDDRFFRDSFDESENDINSKIDANMRTLNRNVISNKRMVHYDRVYVAGAVYSYLYLYMIKRFVKIGGYLVVPYNNHLIRLRRVSKYAWRKKKLIDVAFANIIEPSFEKSYAKLPEIIVESLQELCRIVIRACVRKSLIRQKNIEIKIDSKDGQYKLMNDLEFRNDNQSINNCNPSEREIKKLYNVMCSYPDKDLYSKSPTNCNECRNQLDTTTDTIINPLLERSIVQTDVNIENINQLNMNGVSSKVNKFPLIGYSNELESGLTALSDVESQSDVPFSNIDSQLKVPVFNFESQIKAPVLNIKRANRSGSNYEDISSNEQVPALKKQKLDNNTEEILKPHTQIDSTINNLRKSYFYDDANSNKVLEYGFHGDANSNEFLKYGFYGDVDLCDQLKSAEDNTTKASDDANNKAGRTDLDVAGSRIGINEASDLLDCNCCDDEVGASYFVDDFDDDLVGGGDHDECDDGDVDECTHPKPDRPYSEEANLFARQFNRNISTLPLPSQLLAYLKYYRAFGEDH